MPRSDDHHGRCHPPHVHQHHQLNIKTLSCLVQMVKVVSAYKKLTIVELTGLHDLYSSFHLDFLDIIGFHLLTAESLTLWTNDHASRESKGS